MIFKNHFQKSAVQQAFFFAKKYLNYVVQH